MLIIRTKTNLLRGKGKKGNCKNRGQKWSEITVGFVPFTRNISEVMSIS